MYRIDPITNIFRSEKDQLGNIEVDHFFLSNISLYYVLIAVFIKKVLPDLRNTHNFFLPTAFTLEIVVMSLFWPLFIKDRKLVKNAVIEFDSPIEMYVTEFPMHLFPFLIVLLEFEFKKIEKTKYHRVFFILFCVFYFFISEMLIHRKNVFLYGFLAPLEFYSRIALFIGVLIFTLLSYEISISQINKLVGK
jgi:hypothetical protein